MAKDSMFIYKPDVIKHREMLQDLMIKIILKDINKDIMKEEIKKVYVALAQAVQSGDSLKIGIVLGQTLKQLEEIINND